MSDRVLGIKQIMIMISTYFMATSNCRCCGRSDERERVELQGSEDRSPRLPPERPAPDGRTQSTRRSKVLRLLDGALRLSPVAGEPGLCQNTESLGLTTMRSITDLLGPRGLPLLGNPAVLILGPAGSLMRQGGGVDGTFG
jgi:hypothetical protein